MSCMHLRAVKRAMRIIPRVIGQIQSWTFLPLVLVGQPLSGGRSCSSAGKQLINQSSCLMRSPGGGGKLEFLASGTKPSWAISEFCLTYGTPFRFINVSDTAWQQFLLCFLAYNCKTHAYLSNVVCETLMEDSQLIVGDGMQNLSQGCINGSVCQGQLQGVLNVQLHRVPR